MEGKKISLRGRSGGGYLRWDITREEGGGERRLFRRGRAVILKLRHALTRQLRRKSGGGQHSEHGAKKGQNRDQRLAEKNYSGEVSFCWGISGATRGGPRHIGQEKKAGKEEYFDGGFLVALTGRSFRRGKDHQEGEKNQG